MNQIDSRIQTLRFADSVYATSSPLRSDDWGQPPASYYVLQVDGNHISGQLIGSVYYSTQALRDDLLTELMMWERASDIDLKEFEDKLE